MQITKNIKRGDQITSLDYLMVLARQKKAVVVCICGHHFVRPAAFMVNWPLAQILRTKIFHAIKEGNEA